MDYHRFLTPQRYVILLIGATAFAASLVGAELLDHHTLPGSLMVHLAGASVTIVVTSLVIEYAQFRERASQTKAAAGLAEGEIRATCLRVRHSLSRLYGYGPDHHTAGDVGSRAAAEAYLDNAGRATDRYLEETAFGDHAVTAATVAAYRQDLAALQAEASQALVLYEYALTLTLRETLLDLRRQLQLSERLLALVTADGDLSAANRRLAAELGRDLYGATEAVLGHQSRTTGDRPLHAKTGRVAGD